VQNLDVHDQGGVAVSEVKGKSTVIGYAIHQPNVEGIDHVYDLSIALGCSTMRQLCGARFRTPTPCSTAIWNSKRTSFIRGGA
jgi:hypothetical protein